MVLVWTAVGLALLIIGGELLLRSAGGLALKMKIPRLIVGLTVVSFATSSPELIVSVQAALDSHPDISVGNVIGSNIANIALILGLTSLFVPIAQKWKDYRSDWIFMMVVSVAFGFAMWSGTVSRWEGLFMILAYLAYLYYMYRNARKEKKNRKAGKAEEVKIEHATDELLGAASKPIYLLLLYLVISIFCLKYGAELLVGSAVEIAENVGIPERIISLTLIAFGTSVPELVASLMAAFKGESEMAIGNIVGSNIFNILGVIGISAAIIDVPVLSTQTLQFDFWWMLGIALLLWPLMRYFSPNKLGRFEGGLLTVCYFVYVGMLYFM